MNIRDKYVNIVMFEMCKYNFNKYDDVETLRIRLKEILEDYEWDMSNNQPKPELSKFKRLMNP